MNNRQPKPIRLSKSNDFYDSVGVGAHDDPQNNRPPKSIRPRSFAATPHAVILEQGEESRGATPLEDDTDGAEEGKREKRKEKCRGGYHPPAKQSPTVPNRSVENVTTNGADSRGRLSLQMLRDTPKKFS